MALVPQAWKLNISFKDADNNPSSTSIHYPAVNPFADVDTAAGVAVGLFQALSDAVVTGYSVERVYAQDATAPIAPEISDVERKGYFSFRLDDSRLTSISVPSIKNSLVIDGTNKINRTDAAVLNFLNAVTGIATDSVGVGVGPVVKAEKRHRGSTKG